MAKNINTRSLPAEPKKAQLKVRESFLERFPPSGFRIQVIVLIIITIIFYCNTFSHEAAFDDRMAITDNEYVQHGISGIPDILTKDAYQSYLEQRNGGNQLTGGRYRPLSLITFAIEQQLMGTRDTDAGSSEAIIAGDMPVRHVINVLLYALSVVVLLYFLRNIVFPGDPSIAFMAALFFTIHPIHTEVVANVKSRDEILSFLFISLTFIKAFRYKETLKFTDLLGALICFFLALLSKEYAATLLVLLPLSFYIFKNEPVKFSIKTTMPYLVPFAIYLLLRLNAVSEPAEGAENNVLNNPYLYASVTQKAATEVTVLLDYLKLLVYPNPLIADYSYNQVPYANLSSADVWISGAIYLSLLVIFVALLRKRHVLSFAIAFYLFNLALVSNFFFNIGTTMGERLIYHSSFGFCTAVAWLLYRGLAQFRPPVNPRMAGTALVIMLVITGGYLTIQRNRDWKNDEMLFLADVVKAPNSALVNNNAAAACMSEAKKNREDIALRNEWFSKAIAYFNKAISIYPAYYNAYLNRGLSYFNMGQPIRALADWDTVSKYAPNTQNLAKYQSIAGRYFLALGLKYRHANQFDSAISAFENGLAAKDCNCVLELGKTYVATGKYADGYSWLEVAASQCKSPEAKQLMDQVKAIPAAQEQFKKLGP